jgi:predicted GNAT superfamily acetyltransferase
MSQSGSGSTVTSGIIFRDIDVISEMGDVESLEREVWGCEERDLVPLTVLAATLEVGGLLIGAYERSTLAGFVYGFLGTEDGEVVHHSHMLAVRKSYRNLNLGYRLKLAQRDRVLAQQINRISWTFDPLQSLNAYFNFQKLGVVADKYKLNFYGPTTSSFLHQLGTDRLWATWLLNSKRVHDRLRDSTITGDLGGTETMPLIRVGERGEPERHDATGITARQQVTIEIPDDINQVQLDNPELAVKWHEATRWAFTTALESGFLVEEFLRSPRGEQRVGTYVLSRGKTLQNFD